MNYDYELPKNLIADEPADPRDSSRLLYVNTKKGIPEESTFLKLADFIPSGSLLVLNNTKVIPARVELKKETEGKVNCLFLINELQAHDDVIRVIFDRKIEIGQKLFLEEFIFEVVRQEENIFFLKCLFDIACIRDILFQYGKTPIPPYIKNNQMEEDVLREKYQTVFAESPSSVAAPTASLHFTSRVFDALRKKDVHIATITLHVGMGTFASLSDEMLRRGELHSEFFEIPEDVAKIIKDFKGRNLPIVAVGTTVVRTLESASENILAGQGISGETKIFIKKPFDFKIVDALITNFHVPNSSLLYLVDAFLQYKKSKVTWRDIYEEAIRKNFRFFSFGDGMYIS